MAEQRLKGRREFLRESALGVAAASLSAQAAAGAAPEGARTSPSPEGLRSSPSSAAAPPTRDAESEESKDARFAPATVCGSVLRQARPRDGCR